MRVARLFVGFLVVLGVLGIDVPSSFAASPNPGSAGTAPAVFYLALGDSLAVGFQPGKGKTTGYVGRVWRRFEQQIPGLTLRNVGCPGETSRSLITGDRSPCRYAAGSQLDAAVSFLEAHPGQAAFITIDVGANDLVSRCLDGNTGLIDRACAVDLRPRLTSRLTHILDALGTAAPGTPIVGMTYHDPFLGLWGLVPGGRKLARADQRAWTVFDAGLASAYAGSGAAVADVAATFRIDDFTDTVFVPGRGQIPVNVALACRWTWFCSRRFFGDPHPNWRGYERIAQTFNRELQGVVPGVGFEPTRP
jgi:lysophospholipase L1-like esterase